MQCRLGAGRDRLWHRSDAALLSYLGIYSSARRNELCVCMYILRIVCTVPVHIPAGPWFFTTSYSVISMSNLVGRCWLPVCLCPDMHSKYIDAGTPHRASLRYFFSLDRAVVVYPPLEAIGDGYDSGTCIALSNVAAQMRSHRVRTHTHTLGILEWGTVHTY